MVLRVATLVDTRLSSRAETKYFPHYRLTFSVNVLIRKNQS